MGSNVEPNLEAIELSLAFQIEGYNASEFAGKELGVEVENWTGNYFETNYEAVELELAQHIEVYHAAEYVEAELFVEITDWMKNNDILNSEEIFTDQETEKYAMEQLIIQGTTRE
jgi:hypothetical protein